MASGRGFSCAVGGSPKSLYNLACSAAVVINNLCSPNVIYELPSELQFSLCYTMYELENMSALCTLLSNTYCFQTQLTVSDKRLKLHRMIQALMDSGYDVITRLGTAFLFQPDNSDNNTPVILYGLALGDFIAEAGWFSHAEGIYTRCLRLIQHRRDQESLALALDCCIRILQVQNSNCAYTKASAMVDCAKDILTEFSEESRTAVNKASLYVEVAVLMFANSRYNVAFRHSRLALQEVFKGTAPARVVVDTLRLCAKASVVKREFKTAAALIKNAVKLAWCLYGDQHPKYADTLLDYGFYLLNVDHTCQAVAVYKQALAIRHAVFGGKNLHVAIAHEDLAYAYYVHEYNTGDFGVAMNHANQAIDILKSILYPQHLLLASSKRVKALVLEEMAIDTQDDPTSKDKLLEEALSLHKASLALAKNAFGINNVQTAKHYGNLGRLYQTLRNWKKAEEMHLKAIDIKEGLLGKDDYEVALSVGHLASLYNYDMHKYEAAEVLYKRSIAISVKLFGEGYSGLEYDYRGMIRLYTELNKREQQDEYIQKLYHWSLMRDSQEEEEQLDPFRFLKQETLEPLATIYSTMLKLDSDHDISDTLAERYMGL